MGKIDIAKLPNILKTIYKNIGYVTQGDYLSVSITGVVQRCILVLYFLVISYLILWIIKEKNALKTIELLFILLILPIALDAIELLAPESTKYSLQGLSMVGIFYLPIIMLERISLKRNWIKLCTVAITNGIIMMVTLNYCYTTNVNYTALHYKLELAENYYIVLYSQIVSTDGYTPEKEIVFVGGNRFQNVPKNQWNIGTLEYSGTGFDVNVYSKVKIMELYVGETFRNVTDEELNEYSEIIAQMDVYPCNQSIRVVDELVLVKIAEQN